MTDDRKLVALTYADLRTYGITLTQRRLRTLIAEGAFPKPFQLTPSGRLHWVQAEIEDWLQAKVAGRRKVPVAAVSSKATRRLPTGAGNHARQTVQAVRAAPLARRSIGGRP